MHPRNWVEISRGALHRNYAAVRAKLEASTEICAVVKADGYGHGCVPCASTFAAAGAGWFAVTSVEEGARLRRAGLRGRIIVLAGFAPEEAAAFYERKLTPAVWSAEQIEWLGRAQGAHVAGSTGNGGSAASPADAGSPAGDDRLDIHLKLETGMGRLGIAPEQEAAVLKALAAAPRLRLEAVFTHFSSAESADTATSRAQLHEFERIRRRFGLHVPWHAMNSAAVQNLPDVGGLVARVGLSLYGYGRPDVEPALTWKSRVVSVKDLPAGHAVGYGARFRTTRPSRIATLAVGYADGYRRDLWHAPGKGANVLLRGQPAPVVGAISMDLTAVDVSRIPGVALGDTATLIGRAGEHLVTANDLAGLAGTIPYEILCGVSARVERHYVD